MKYGVVKHRHRQTRTERLGDKKRLSAEKATRGDTRSIAHLSEAFELMSLGVDHHRRKISSKNCFRWRRNADF